MRLAFFNAAAVPAVCKEKANKVRLLRCAEHMRHRVFVTNLASMFYKTFVRRANFSRVSGPCDLRRKAKLPFSRSLQLAISLRSEDFVSVLVHRPISVSDGKADNGHAGALHHAASDG